MNWKLLLIVCIAFVVRIYSLGNIPVGIHGDEASIGYNAYSLLKTGKDQNGNVLPLVIDQFGDYRPAGYHYLDIPFVALLGLNEWALRLPSALFGIGMVALIYFLALELFNNKRIAFLSSLFLAISPWHVIVSRSTSEGVVAAFLIMLGLYALMRNYKVISFFSLTGSFLFYHSARLFVPLMLSIVFIALFRNRLRHSRRSLILLIIAVFCSLASILIITKGAARPSSISIFNIPGGDRQITQQIGEDGTQKPMITRFLHNKVLFYSNLFMYNYFQHLSGSFLFASTGKPVRYDVPWSSVLYLADLPLLVFGLSVLISDGIRKKSFKYLFPIFWLILGALPAGLTYEDIPNVQRASLMIPAFVLISAVGFEEFFSLWKKKQKNLLMGIYGIALAYCTIIFFHNYFYHLPKHEPWHRSAAQKELIKLITDYRDKYKKIVMTTEGNNNFIFYLFYTGYDPGLFQQKGSPKEINGLEFENVSYYYQKCPLGVDSDNPVSEDPMIIFVNKSDCKIPINTDILNTVRHPDGTPAYHILKVNPFWVPKQS